MYGMEGTSFSNVNLLLEITEGVSLDRLRELIETYLNEKKEERHEQVKVGDRVRCKADFDGRHVCGTEGTEQAKPPKPAFAVGDRVKVNKTGKTGTVIGIKGDGTRAVMLVDYDEAGAGLHNGDGFELTSGHYGTSENCQWRYPRGLTRIDKPAPKPREEAPKAETIKLYCIKEHEPGRWVTKGKIYEMTGRRIVFDSGWGTNCNDLATNQFDAPGTELGNFLVRLVKRPAKVGEWVYIEKPYISLDEYEKGSVLRVTKRNEGTSISHPHIEADGIKIDIMDSEYLVLDGYQPEPEQPKYWSGKVVCVEHDHCDFFTPGKVYTFENGYVRCDDGVRYNGGEPIQSVDDLSGEDWVPRFIEFKGEQGGAV